MGWRAVESFHSSQEPITGRHGRGQPDVFRVQRFIIIVLELNRRGAMMIMRHSDRVGTDS